MSAQSGHNLTFDQGISMRIHAINYGADDNLYTLGPIIPPDSSFQGVFVGVLDTFGNVLRWTTIQDPDKAAILATSKETGMVTTDEGVTMLPLNFLGLNSIGLAIVNADSVLLREYPQNTLLVMIPRDIVPCYGGFLICGDAQMPNYNVDAAIMKIDKEGNIVWSHTYGHPVYWEVTKSIIARDENAYAVSGVRDKIGRDTVCF